MKVVSLHSYASTGPPLARIDSGGGCDLCSLFPTCPTLFWSMWHLEKDHRFSLIVIKIFIR